jgi:hypothetical protein
MSATASSTMATSHLDEHPVSTQQELLNSPKNTQNTRSFIFNTKRHYNFNNTTSSSLLAYSAALRHALVNCVTQKRWLIRHNAIQPKIKQSL